jgi:hypothetical protein
MLDAQIVKTVSVPLPVASVTASPMASTEVVAGATVDGYDRMGERRQRSPECPSGSVSRRWLSCQSAE